MRQQIESVVFDLFSWKEGTFSFTDDPDGPAAADARVRVTTESLLMEGARRIDEWGRMSDRIPSADVAPRLAERRDDADSYIDLRPAEWETLALVDGEHTIRDIASELASTEFEVAKTVYGMLSTGLIEIMTEREVAA